MSLNDLGRCPHLELFHVNQRLTLEVCLQLCWWHLAEGPNHSFTTILWFDVRFSFLYQE